MDQIDHLIEVRPHDDGTWSWQERSGGDVNRHADGIETRREAIAAARTAAGSEDFTLTRADGSAAGTVRLGGRTRIVLLRLDGSLVGELDHAATGDAAQHIATTPATENSEGVA